MKFANYNLSNILGSVYTQGNICFTPNGNYLLAPIGNRISVYDLVNNKSFAFPFENGRNISVIAVSPDGNLILSVDEDGRCILSHLHKRAILARITFASPVDAVKFSPDSRYIAVALEQKNSLQIWRTPLIGLETENVLKEFSPFVIWRTLTGHFDRITDICWSPLGDQIMTASNDMSVRIYNCAASERVSSISLVGHRDKVISARWSLDGSTIYTVSQDGSCFIWEICRKGEKIWASLLKKHIFRESCELGSSRVSSAAFSSSANLLVVGFSNGVFGVWELLDFSCIHTLSISQSKIDSIDVSSTGDWFAFGSKKLNQLLVWEWQSESYVLKQQAHSFDMNCVAFSNDGQTIVTGGADGRIKLWNAGSGFCFLTLDDHQASVSSIRFASKKSGKQNVLFSASLDGTVRAYDLVRFRNFRVFTAPTPVGFNCLAVDPSGDLVCASGIDSFDIYVWNVQNGHLVDILTGHEGPVSSLSFSPDSSTSDSAALILASGSWDKTVRIWDLFSSGKSKCQGVYSHKSEVLCVSFRPDGQELCSSLLEGSLNIWSTEKFDDGILLREIDVRRDVRRGRYSTDVRVPEAGKNHFTTITYAMDGSLLLAGGESKWICLYDTNSGVLLRKYCMSTNQALEGILDRLNSANMTDFGPISTIEDEEDSLDLESRLQLQKALPGVEKGDLGKRKSMMSIRCADIGFDPTGKQFAVASSTGLLLFDSGVSVVYDPYGLELELNTDSVLKLYHRCKSGADDDWARPLSLALRLDSPSLSQMIYENIPFDQVSFVVRSLSPNLLPQFLSMISVFLDGIASNDTQSRLFQRSPHIEFHLKFLENIMQQHLSFIRDNYYVGPDKQISSIHVIIRALKSHLYNTKKEVGKVCDENMNMIKYYCLDTPSKGGELNNHEMDLTASALF